jgi:hypothetical protein
MHFCCCCQAESIPDVDIERLEKHLEACGKGLNSNSELASQALDILKTLAEDPRKWKASEQHGCWGTTGVLQALLTRLKNTVDSNDQQQQSRRAKLVVVLSLVSRDVNSSKSMRDAVPHLLKFLISVPNQQEQQEAAVTAINNIVAAAATTDQNSVTQLQQQLQDKDTELRTLQQELQETQEQLQRALADCSTPQSAAAAETEQTDTQQLQQLRQEHALAAERHSLVLQQLRQAQGQCRALQQQLQQQEEMIAQNEQLQQQHAQLTSELTFSRAALAAAEELWQKTEAECSELRQNLQELLNLQELQNMQLKEQAGAQLDNASLRQQLQQLQQEVCQAKTDCSSLQQQLHQLNTENKELSCQLQHAQQRCTALEQQQEQNTTQYELLQQQHAQLTDSHAALLLDAEYNRAAEAASKELWQKTEAECSELRQKLQELLDLQELQKMQLKEQAEALDTPLGRVHADWQQQPGAVQQQQQQQQQQHVAAARCQQCEELQQQQLAQQRSQQKWSRVGDARLLQLLSHDNGEIAEAAVTELARRVSGGAINLGTVSRDSTSNLLQLMAKGSATAQQHAVSVLRHSIDTRDAATADRILTAGGLTQLKRLLGANRAEVQENAAAAIARLAECSVRVRVPELVPPLAALLSNDSEGVQRCAAAALNNIALNSACIPSIRTSGGIKQLVQLLRSPNQKVNNAALVALRSVVYCDASSKTAVRLANGLAPVVDLLKSSDVGVQINAAKAVCALVAGGTPGTGSSANGEDFVVLEAPAALQLLEQSSDLFARHAAVEARKVLGGFSAAGSAAAAAKARSSQPDTWQMGDQFSAVEKQLPRV